MEKSTRVRVLFSYYFIILTDSLGVLNFCPLHLSFFS